VTRTGKKYAIANGAHRLVVHDADSLGPWGVVPQHAQQQSFSGCYFATPEFFSRIKFRKRRLLPVEHATGFDAKATACASRRQTSSVAGWITSALATGTQRKR
jgi:formylglycine-generating enzyme required for sulfatase activity